MGSALLILVPIVLLATLLTGGFSSQIKEEETSSIGNPVKLLGGAIGSAAQSLQIFSQGVESGTILYSYPTPGYSYPTPSYSYPTPSYSYPTPSYSYPTPSYSYPTPNTPACTTNLDCGQGACPSSRIRTCTYRGPQPCNSVPFQQSCTPAPPPITPICTNCTNCCQQYNPVCGACPHRATITCSNGKCISVDLRGLGGGVTNDCDRSPYYQDKCAPFARCGSGGTYCFTKPVIYLYPTKRIFIDVEVKTTGKIVVSDPLYPEEGWKNVEAHPDGTLYYQGQKYRELFYETDIDKINPPSNGIILKTSNLKVELENIITKLGLTRKDEQTEFLDWWLPRLSALNSPYILFSILDPVEKEKTDHIIISPRPDTFIHFIAYFKSLAKLISITPLIIPVIPPERVGFTAVEWGGVVDDK